MPNLRFNNNKSRRYQGGKSNNKGNNGSSKPKGKRDDPPPRLELKFTPMGPGSRDFAPYSTTLEGLEQKVRAEHEHGHDVAACIENGKRIDLDKDKPVRKKSVLQDEDDRKFEQETFNMEYYDQLKSHNKRVEKLDTNLHKLHGEIFKDYCTKAMQSKVMEQADFDSRIKDDPLALLQVVQVLMRDPQTTKYVPAMLCDFLKSILFLRQREDETTMEYAERFKAEWKELEHITGHKLI